MARIWGWTQDEIDYLYANYKTMLYKEMAAHLKRSVSSVGKQMLKMGLRKHKPANLTEKPSHKEQKNSICWNCARVGKETCSWDKSRGKVVVEGAKYKQLFSNCYTDGEAKIITKCPLFIRG